MDETRERRWTFLHWLGVAILIYVAPLLVIALDVLFFNSRIQRIVGPEIESIWNNAYWPIIVIMEYLMRWLA